MHSMANNNIAAERAQIIIKEALVQYVIQLRARNDPEAPQWTPTNEHAVAGGMFFIDERQTSGDYEILKVPTLKGQLSGQTMKTGFCNVTEEDAEAKREDWLLFPNLDRIMTFVDSDAKKRIAKLAQGVWTAN